MGWPSKLKRLSQRAMSLPCPIAARACTTAFTRHSYCIYELESMVQASIPAVHLLLRKGLGSLFQLHPLEAHANGARADEHDPVTQRSQGTYRLDDGREQGEPGLQIGFGDNGGCSELDDDGELARDAHMAGVAHRTRCGWKEPSREPLLA